MSAHPLSHKIFRGSIALEAQLGETRITDARPKPISTVNLVAASAINHSDKRHATGYDWENNALRLQVSPREMCDVLATLLGYRESVEFTHHGTQRDKSYSITNDGTGKASLLMNGGGHKPYHFGLNPNDRFELASLCFRVFQKQHGGINAEVLMAMLKDTYCSQL